MEFWGSQRRKLSPGSWIKASTLVAILVINQTGCGKGQDQAPDLAGLSQFHAEIIDRSLYLSFRASALTLDAGLTLPIPGLGTSPASTIALTPDLTGKGAVFQAVIQLEGLSKLTSRPCLSPPFPMADRCLTHAPECCRAGTWM